MIDGISKIVCCKRNKLFWVWRKEGLKETVPTPKRLCTHRSQNARLTLPHITVSVDENISAEGQEFDCSQVKCSKGAVNEYKRLGKVDSDGLNKLSVAGHCVTTGGQSVTH